MIDNHVIDDGITQGNDVHLVMKGYTTGSVKAAGDLVTTRGRQTREETRNSELKKTKIAILGLRTTDFIQLIAGFKVQHESVSKVRTLLQLLLV